MRLHLQVLSIVRVWQRICVSIDMLDWNEFEACDACDSILLEDIFFFHREHIGAVN